MADGTPQPDHAEPRHGFLVDEIRILIPRGVRSQYLPAIPVFPVPRATSRLRGLVHWRGQAIVAIDPGDEPAPDLPVIGVCNLLLLGPDGEAIGLVQRAPPLIVTLTDKPADARIKPDCWLADSLDSARLDQDQQIWWELDLSLAAQSLHSGQLTNV